MRTLLGFLLLTAAFTVPPQNATASGTATPATQIGEHRFVPTLAAFEPFITTHFRTSPGLGMALDLQVPFRNLEGVQIATLEGDVAFLMMEMEYQKAVLDWLAIRAAVTGVARAGTNEQSVLFQGVSAINGYGIGALFRLWENDRAMLSASGDLRQSTLFSVTPLAFVKSVLDGGGLGEAGENSLLEEDDSYRTTAGLKFAYAINKWWGFSLLAETGGANPFKEKEKTEFLFTGGAGISFDIGAGTSVPVGFTLTYLDDSFPENGDDVAESIRSTAFGLSYTGRDDFSIGAEATYSRIPLRQSESTVNSILLRLKLYYFF